MKQPVARSEEFRIVLYSSDLRARVLELQRHLWGEDVANNSRYFAWKYEDNPYIEQPLLFLVFAHGQLVAMRGAFGSKWEVNGGAWTIPHLCDSVVAPEYRGCGLIGLINEHAVVHLADLGYPFVIGMSANPTMFRATRRIGAQDLGNLDRLVMEVQKAPADRSLPNWKAEDVRISRFPDPASMASLAARVSRSDEFRHVRDDIYYRWRFNNPMCSYHFFYTGDDALRGYLVVQTSVKAGHSRGNIVDWAVEDPDCFDRLLAAAIGYGITPRLQVWAATLTSEQSQMIERAGFVSSGPVQPGVEYFPTVQVRPTGKSVPSFERWQLAGCRLLDLSNWNLRMIFTDSN